MRNAENWLIIGSSGSGKSYFLKMLLNATIRRYQYRVCVNSSEQLAELYAHREFVSFDELETPRDPAKIAELIKHYRSVHFEVATGKTQRFMDALGQACMLLGRTNATTGVVQVVVEEAINYLPKWSMPRGFARIEAEGRKYGVDVVKITQRLGASGREALDHACITNATRLAIFPLTEPNDRQRVSNNWPMLPDPGTLQFPATNRGGEYLIYDRLRGQGVKVALTATNRVEVPLVAKGDKQ